MQMKANDEANTCFKLAQDNLPSIDDFELARLAAMTDEDIDFSDVPETDETFWLRPGLMRRRKASAIP